MSAAADRPPRAQSFSNRSASPDSEGAVRKVASQWLGKSPERRRSNASPGSQGRASVVEPTEGRRERTTPVDSDPEARRKSSSSPGGLQRAKSFASGGEGPQNFTLKRTMTRMNMNSMAEINDNASVRSGQGGMFSHNLPQKITRAIIKPKVLLNEEDRVCSDLLKCCAAMEGRWSVTAHATYNGAAQSLLQTSMDVLRKPESWQSWWSNLTDSAKNLEELARRLYLEDSSERMSDYDDDPMHPIGTSRLNERTQTMLHAWQNPEAAKAFAHGWMRIWQCLLEHRIEGLFAPYSVMFCIEGKYVSVTSLPPLMVKDSPPALLPGREPANCLLAHAAEQLIQALLLPPDTAGFAVAAGFDGRYYIVSLKEALNRRLPPPFEQTVVRMEALYRCMKDSALSQSDVYVLRTLVPQAVEDIAKAVMRRKQEERSIADLTKEGLMRMMLHANGVNMQLLHHVSLCAQHRFLETQDSAYRTILDLAYTEMAGRILKQFIRVDIAAQAADGRDTENDRLDVVNRFAQLLVSKDQTFWSDYMVPALRVKYQAPDTFELTIPQVHIPTVLRVASARIGCEYAPEAQRFNRFTTVSGMWLLCCKAPDWLATEVPRTAEQVKEDVMRMWKDAECHDGAKGRRCFKARAFVTTVMLNTATSVAKDEYDKLSQYADAQGPTMDTRIEDIRLTSFMVDMRMEPAEKRRLVERYVKKVSKFPSGNFALDGSLITTKYLQAVNMLKSIGDVPPVELIEAALRQFNSIPGLNFPFSSVHAQALVTAEGAVGGLSEQAVPVFHTIVLEAKRVIGELHGATQLAKYLHRACWSIVDAPLAESHPISASIAAEGFRAHVSAYGIEDNRCAQMAFLTALFACRASSKVVQEGLNLRDSLRKISDSMRAVAAANQIAISRAGISLTILHRSEIIIRKSQISELTTAGNAVLDFLKRFGTPLFASLFIQRVGRGFDDRRWMDWLRRDTNCKVLQRIGRGLLHRKYRMFALFKKKVMKQRTILDRFVQRIGRGYLARKDMYRMSLVRCVLNGALARVRFNRRKWFIRSLQRIGRGYNGRLLVAAPYQEEQMRRLEMDRQRRLQEERERLSAAAERCRQRMLEVQRKLLEAAWDRVRVCMTDEARYREQLDNEYQREFQGIGRMRQKDLIRVEEYESRRKDFSQLEVKAREEEDRKWREELKKPCMMSRRRDLFVETNPPLTSLPISEVTAASPHRGSRPSPWESSAGRQLSAPAAQLRFEEQYDRRMIRRQFLDELEILFMWGMHCRLTLSRHSQRKKTSILAELKRKSAGAAYNEESATAEWRLHQEYAAIQIQCAWRANSARFERRYRHLHREAQRRHVFAKYYEGQGNLQLPAAMMEAPKKSIW